MTRKNKSEVEGYDCLRRMHIKTAQANTEQKNK